MCSGHAYVGVRLAILFSRVKLCAMPAKAQSLGFMSSINFHYDCSVLDCSGKIEFVGWLGP